MMPQPPTTTPMKRGLSDYQTCQRNGWGVGTRLVGDEGYGPTVIEITYLSEQNLLALTISRNGVEQEHPYEGLWTLTRRHWQVVR